MTIKKWVLLGIGNELNGDDGVGPYCANNLEHPDWHTIDCATAPENFTGAVGKLSPKGIIIVDAALMGLHPGSIRIITENTIAEVGFSTHTISLEYLIRFLKDECPDCPATLIGVEPKSKTIGDPLSKEALLAAHSLIDALKKHSWQNIPVL